MYNMYGRTWWLWVRITRWQTKNNGICTKMCRGNWNWIFQTSWNSLILQNNPHEAFFSFPLTLQCLQSSIRLSEKHSSIFHRKISFVFNFINFSSFTSQIAINTFSSRRVVIDLPKYESNYVFNSEELRWAGGSCLDTKPLGDLW